MEHVKTIPRIVEGENRWLPVEVKWSDAPAERDARRLQTWQEIPRLAESLT